MRKVILALLLLAAGAAQAQFGGMFPGPGTVHSAASPSLAVSGFANSSWSSGTTSTISLTTTAASEIIVFPMANGASISSVVGSTLGAFSLRATCSGTCSGVMDEYAKYASGALTGETITITYSATPSFGQNCSLGISGVNSGAPFDTNASLPAISGSGTGDSATTTAATTLGVSASRLNSASTTADTGWTATYNANFMLCEWTNTVGNSLVIADPTSNGSQIIDAVKP